jgi:hypothetical protein
MGSFDHLHSNPFNVLNYIKDKLFNVYDSSENIILFTPKKEQK